MIVFPDEIKTLREYGEGWRHLSEAERGEHALTLLLLWHELYQSSKAPRKEKLWAQDEEEEIRLLLNSTRASNDRV